MAEEAAGIPAWRFDFVNLEKEPLGHLVLVFTTDAIDEPTCGYAHWKKAVVLEDGLNFDFGTEFRPAYTIFGPWLTMDLTSASCNIDHTLIGDIGPDEASGTFNLAHPLGGSNLGRFTAQPTTVD